MSQPKRQEEREWKSRKQSQKPHGKVPSNEQLADDAEKTDMKK